MTALSLFFVVLPVAAATPEEITEQGLSAQRNGDYDLAKFYYEEAAAQGYDEAQNKLGYMYQQGLGVKTDYARAKFYYEQAAAQGNADHTTISGSSMKMD
ncbi:tetratricopeptide repeat protein [Testudinibacter aquarius]|uniref:Sel1 repeat family protein n=1 Tax=Testudinibacter aquarius TaxID=1524974 RepID=A0A4R3XZ77_9PAST|nr:SEL1-like repeat protein [Testudinibacter aquarius]KAE9528298.1 hypothetical protein A1D24_10340 [Testudinibacter aquarius]TCV83648.1 Sel1 repeat-containing protein [Testudinibacter aquarius]TNG91570.1 sel1 repeat family protein [Testudinibacter aquarius]